jgi:hypothetical protein
MKRFVLFGIMLLMTAGCAPFQEAYYIEREFGKESRAAWDAQIVHKDGRYGDRVPEGMSGITAEEVMRVRNQTFSEEATRSQVFEFELGGSR